MAALTFVGAATVVLAAVLAPAPDSLVAHWPLFTVLSAAVIIAELRPIGLFNRGMDEDPDVLTVSAPFAVALLVVGPLWLVLVVQALVVVWDDLRTRRPWHKICYNAAQYVVSLALARVALAVTGGPGLSSSYEAFTLGDVVPTIVAGIVFVVVNHVLVDLVVSLDTGQPLHAVLVDDARFVSATQAVLVSLAPLTAFVAAASIWMVLLLLLPLFALHRNAQQTVHRERQAVRDPLTGLGNRSFFELHAGRLIRERTGAGESCTVLLVGLDHFDEINDALGSSVGDAVLVEVADRLAACVPRETVAARLGDQFALLVPRDLAGAHELVPGLLERLDRPAELGNLRLLIQANVGLANAPQHGSGAEELLRSAGMAMHDPTRQRGRVSTYNSDAAAGTRERLQMLSELRVAIDEDQFLLVFQPQVALPSGEIAGIEALVRWQHPVRGLVYPDSFIALAENSGLIAQITDVVLDQALAAIGRLRTDGHRLRVAVNIPARQMSDLSLPGVVAEALARHRVPPEALTLEVTETGILNEIGRAGTVVGELRKQGVSIAVDDYGTGQASLNYLKRLVVDELKIDKSFVMDMGSDTGDAIIVRSTIELGHDLGLRIVAEGVEDAATLGLLRGLGADLAQGWHLGRPMAEAQLWALLERQRQPAGEPSPDASGQG